MKTPFAKYRLTHEPAIRQMLTVDRVRALEKGMKLTGNRTAFEEKLRLLRKLEKKQ